MEFGRVEASQLDAIDLKLPKEAYGNSKVLRGNKCLHPQLYVGLSKWGKKEWVGTVYPKGTREAAFQEQYQQHFNAIEFNATHYKLPSEQDITRWLEKAQGREFKFCPKLYQGISHYGKLDDKQFLTGVFLKTVSGLGQHLGPVFIQVSDKFGPKRKEELFSYLQWLPKDIPFFLELRHPDWFTESLLDEVSATLKKLKIGWVISDTAGRRDAVHMQLTIPKAMIRFVGNDLHDTDFKRLDEWVSRIQYWVESGLEEAYFFIHSLDESHAPGLAQYFIHQLNKGCNAGLKEITFIT
jgi:uncharacterized protein YecE (DUF72 family)